MGLARRDSGHAEVCCLSERKNEEVGESQSRTTERREEKRREEKGKGMMGEGGEMMGEGKGSGRGGRN
jgi:hypothetical protein